MELKDKLKVEPLATGKSRNADKQSDVEIRSELAESEGDTYQLARDGERRTIRPPKKYVVAYLIAYALSVITQSRPGKMAYTVLFLGRSYTPRLAN